jgi:5,10-methylenetetrahydromethanopterin reductase
VPNRLGFGLNRHPVGSIAAFIAAVRQEEALGFDYAWIPDSALIMPDPYVLAAAALQATERIHAGPLLSNPVTRHPATIANGAATLGLIAPGRAAVGMGAGDTAVHTVGRHAARLAEVGEALRIARALLHGEAPELGGPRPVALVTRGTAELWGAASGPRSARIAGAYADVVVLRCGLAPENLNPLADLVEQGARDAGRDPATLRFAAIVHTLPSDDAAAALAQARVVAAGFYELAPALWQRAGLTWNGPPLAQIAAQVYPDIVHAQDIPAAAKLVEFIQPEAVDAFALHGDAQAVSSGLERVVAGFPRLAHVITQPLRVARDYAERIAEVARGFR